MYEPEIDDAPDAPAPTRIFINPFGNGTYRTASEGGEVEYIRSDIVNQILDHLAQHAVHVDGIPEPQLPDYLSARMKLRISVALRAHQAGRSST